MQPLADQLRPSRVRDIVGQAHLTDQTSVLTPLIQGTHAESVIFWGPPGCGKTSFARLLVNGFPGGQWNEFQATSAGVKEMREVFQRPTMLGEQVRFLFIDEIHRFTRTQQDSLLGAVESGRVVLMGATTENPSFALTGALLSRCRVVVLEPLGEAALLALIGRAESYLDHRLALTDGARVVLAQLADGDGRYLLNMVEILGHRDQQLLKQHAQGQGGDAENASSLPLLDEQGLVGFLARRPPQHDRAGEAHYNLISALHKSLRASDTDAALYWLARMLIGGDDPHYIARRLLRFAYEDIGAADPQAAVQALTAWQTYERLGSPEGEIALVQVVVYLGTAPKSNAVYTAQKAATQAAKKHGSFPPPKRIRNPVTGLMKSLGYGEGYIYDHDTEQKFSGHNCFPDEMARAAYYVPGGFGFEREIAKRLAWWASLRKDD
ncbi:MAG: replication-associated recombination protein A [Alphaproteobacteria bacterium]|nr:replication-associated recombination protein A [Alphaproteobacteria bacterium]